MLQILLGALRFKWILFRGWGTLGRLLAIFHMEDNLCDLLLAFLQNNPLLKRDLLKKERIWEQILSF